jgi:hypothetical protein
VQRFRSEDYALCGGASFSPNAPIAAVDGLIWSPDGVAWLWKKNNGFQSKMTKKQAPNSHDKS